MSMHIFIDMNIWNESSVELGPSLTFDMLYSSQEYCYNWCARVKQVHTHDHKTVENDNPHFSPE